MELKYNQEIEHLISLGLRLPLLNEPNDKEAYRFIFRNDPNRNHLPAYIMNPKRLISDLNKSNATTSGYALSCYEKEESALNQFNFLKSRFPKIYSTIGDSLSKGNISNSDGWVSPADIRTHFDLYESPICNLSATFQFLYDL